MMEEKERKKKLSQMRDENMSERVSDKSGKP